MLRPWKELPKAMQCKEVRPYYKSLYRKRGSLAVKRILDIILAGILLLILSIPMIVIGIMVKLDSPGPVFYRQERVTSYGKRFRIHKFRTMVEDAEARGSAVTIKGDSRITRVGARLRDKRLDELPQLIDIIKGDMTFVGTRPEATKYVEAYSEEMLATLLLPAGLTSEASIRYKDEAWLLEGAADVDRVYIEKVLPQKMRYNLEDIRNYSLIKDISTLIRTALAVTGKNYE